MGLGTRAVGPTLVALLLASPLSAQSLFDRVPPLTRGCYGGQDSYLEDLEAVRTAIQTEMDGWEEANNALSSAVDPAAQTQRVMAAMQANPQGAMELMQRQQMAPEETSAFLTMNAELESAFEVERENLLNEYRETFDTRVAAIRARIGNLSDPGGPSNPNYMAELRVESARYDAEYVAHCGEWFGPTGRFAEYVGRYRAYLLEEWLPPTRKFFDLERDTLEFFGGVDVTEYRFTGEHEAVVRFMNPIVTFLGWRELQPMAG
jgi:hypothetical protein